jgi:hypothetical protein
MKYILIAVNIIIVLTLLVRAIINGFFSNTIGIETFVTILLTIGLFLALFISNRYIKSRKIKDRIEKTQVTLLICTISMLTLLAIGVNLNYLVSMRDAGLKNIPIMEIQPFYKTSGGIIKGEIVKPSGYFVKIFYQGKQERLQFKSIENYQQFVGQTVGLHLRKGILGFDVCLPKPMAITNNL